MRYLIFFALMVFVSGCICCGSQPVVHSVTFYGNESTTTTSQGVVFSSTQTTISDSTTSSTLLFMRNLDATSSTSSTLIVSSISSSTQSADVLALATQAYLSSTTSADVVSYSLACLDSDNGLNVDVRGHVEFEGVAYVDYCVGEKIFEHYCDDGVEHVLEIICATGCSGGRCN